MALDLLTTAEMSEADRLAANNLAAQGIAQPGFHLMLAAGRAVAQSVARLGAGRRILFVCGPGNNGGDGYVAARLVAARPAFSVTVATVGDHTRLKGDAARAAAFWAGDAVALTRDMVAAADVIVDAMFGAGLSRELSGDAAEAVAWINAAGKPVIAVDVPSGLDGSTGAVTGPAIGATRTTTFFRRKPGHLLLPGRALCGRIEVRDIGIPASVLTEIGPRTFANGPALWSAMLPRAQVTGHKYARGHALVVSGPVTATGAARLGAHGALRAGAGLVTIASPAPAAIVNAAHLTAIMLLSFEQPAGLAKILDDARKNAVLIGPGCGVDADTRAMAKHCLESQAAVVLDADAITAFAEPSESALPAGPFGFLGGGAQEAPATPETLFAAIKARANANVVLTPHEGEFRRLFAGLDGAKTARARRAAAMSGAVVVLKGPDTVIASPDGRAAINENAPPWLATAGSGDVLAGIVTGLMAQGMPGWEAACAGVWLHGACAALRGPGLVAEDLPGILPEVFASL
ncbi:MAG: NAD(P)H-hydrate dehydratase [Hyphomicrobiaceae bacterium]